VDRPGTHLNPQVNVHSDPIVRSSKSSLSGEVVAEEANTRMKEVSSAPNKDVNVRGMETTAANSESEQGDQLHQRAVRYMHYTLFTVTNLGISQFYNIIMFVAKSQEAHVPCFDSGHDLDCHPSFFNVDGVFVDEHHQGSLCTATNIIRGVCVPYGVYSSVVREKMSSSAIFVVAYLLPLTVMIFCYSRIVYALRFKVSTHHGPSFFAITTDVET